MQVTSAQQLPSETTTLNFLVTDACGSTGTGTLTIVVTNVVSYEKTNNGAVFQRGCLLMTSNNSGLILVQF